MPPSRITLSAFVDAIVARDRLRHVAFPGFAARRVKAEAHVTCTLCSRPYNRSLLAGPDFPVLASLVHPALGGPLSPDNAFICCRRCQQGRASADLIASGTMPTALAARRVSVLLTSHNHLLPLSINTRPADFLTALALRHSLARSRVFAAQGEDGHCLFGVSSRFGDPQAKGLAHFLMRAAGTCIQDTGRISVYQCGDDTFRRVVWQLIDANTLVVALACRENARDFLDCWWPTLSSPTALRMRHVGFVVPKPKPILQALRESGSALRMRRLRERRRVESELYAVERKAERARHALNEQCKARWLDRQDAPAELLAQAIQQCCDADNRLANLRRRLSAIAKQPSVLSISPPLEASG